MYVERRLYLDVEEDTLVRISFLSPWVLLYILLRSLLLLSISSIPSPSIVLLFFNKDSHPTNHHPPFYARILASKNNGERVWNPRITDTPWTLPSFPLFLQTLVNRVSHTCGRHRDAVAWCSLAQAKRPTSRLSRVSHTTDHPASAHHNLES